MTILNGYQPAHVVRYFEEICAIPHPSHHEQALCAYIRGCAERYGHRYVEDAAGNLMVYLNATPGYEDKNNRKILLNSYIIDSKYDGLKYLEKDKKIEETENELKRINLSYENLRLENIELASTIDQIRNSRRWKIVDKLGNCFRKIINTVKRGK